MHQNNQVSGFDMVPTLAWYAAHIPELLAKLHLRNTGNHRIPYAVGERPQGFPLTTADMDQIIGIFPGVCHDRSRLIAVEFQPATWFRRDSTPERPQITTSVDEALSSTAIVPSMVKYAHGVGGKLNTTIVMFGLGAIANLVVRRIVAVQAFAHEFAHSIIAPALYESSHRLAVIGRGEFDGASFLIGEADNLLNPATAVSHYASTYLVDRDPEDARAMLTAINESLAEAMAAHVLGFAFRIDGTGLRPFAGREQLLDVTERFMSAELVTS